MDQFSFQISSLVLYDTKTAADGFVGCAGI